MLRGCDVDKEKWRMGHTERISHSPFGLKRRRCAAIIEKIFDFSGTGLAYRNRRPLGIADEVEPKGYERTVAQHHFLIRVVQMWR